MRTSLVVVSLALLAGLGALGARTYQRVSERDSDSSLGPSFAVEVEKPRSARPLFGLLPKEIEAKLAGDGALRFDNASKGAEIGRLGHDRIELSADGWDLSIRTDGEGEVAPATYLVFPIELAGKKRRLRCRAADRAFGYLQISTPTGPDVFDGRFLVKLATCENAETGKTLEWPPAPLTARGRFAGLRTANARDQG